MDSPFCLGLDRRVSLMHKLVRQQFIQQLGRQKVGGLVGGIGAKLHDVESHQVAVLNHLAQETQRGIPFEAAGFRRSSAGSYGWVETIEVDGDIDVAYQLSQSK